MLRLFGKKERKDADSAGAWKSEFNDCVTSDYLPDYSVCLCDNNRHCRFIAMYSGMTLCSNPDHKDFSCHSADVFGSCING